MHVIITNLEHVDIRVLDHSDCSVVTIITASVAVDDHKTTVAAVANYSR